MPLTGLGGLMMIAPAVESAGIVVTSVTPNTGYDFGGTAVTISGSGFTGATSVIIGSANAVSVVVVDDNTITCVTGDADEPTSAVNTYVYVGAAYGVTAGLFTYWSPKSLANLAQWLDTHLSSYVIHSVGNDVERWNDRSGNSRDVFAASGEEPTFLGAGPPGSIIGNCIEFEATPGDWLKTASFTAANNGYTVFSVSNRYNGVGDTYYEHLSPGVATKGFNVGMGQGSGGDFGFPVLQTSLGDGSAFSNQYFISIDSDWTLYRYRGGTGSSFTPEIWVNGSIASSFSSDGYDGPDSGTADGLGVFAGGASGDVQRHSEIIYYDRKLSDADCDLVEAYMNAKWGESFIVTWLPSDASVPLVGWFKGDDELVTGGSGSWGDQSGENNDLAAGGSGPDTGATLNGHATCRLANGSRNLLDSSFNLGAAGAISIAMVVNVTSAIALEMLATYGDGAFDDHAIGANGTTDANIFVHNFAANSSDGSTDILNTWVSLVFTDVAAGSQIGYVNNTSETSQSTAGSIADDLAFTIGATADYAEIAVFRGVLSSGDRSDWQTYVSDRYAI